jgi:hypothetical protein
VNGTRERVYPCPPMEHDPAAHPITRRGPHVGGEPG